jgi:hypothetical protein
MLKLAVLWMQTVLSMSLVLVRMLILKVELKKAGPRKIARKVVLRMCPPLVF